MSPLLNPHSYPSTQPNTILPAAIKPYSKQELTHLYNISYKALSNWLFEFKEEIGERRGRFYSVLQVEIIFSKLGVPYVRAHRP